MDLRVIFGDVVAIEPWRALLAVRPGCGKKRAQNVAAELLSNPSRAAEFPFPVVELAGKRLVRVADVQRVIDGLAVIAGPTPSTDVTASTVSFEKRRPGRPRKIENRS